MDEWYMYEKAAIQFVEHESSLNVRERMINFGSDSISNLDLVVAILGSGIHSKPVRKLRARY